ncbi:helix-turn-helix transcriptional regulator [Streptomyces sp. NBC_01310]|uniref:helix-turn-helix transcriptional regulator n=1 Tax=Streptomyces sp. NBC_01310 TaxID=2903820 RepID=UPI0035B69DB9|nr:helix-turn-helix transcriptional regulator [Streptomyces sp. NBC_01310]WSJ64395.1 helix-turn-helix transcriptional regulator [Streptomyces sp. NBC_01310]
MRRPGGGRGPHGAAQQAGDRAASACPGRPGPASPPRPGVAARARTGAQRCARAARSASRGGRRGYGGQLSPRETEVVRLMLPGMTNRQMPVALSRSPHTVAVQPRSAMRKHGVTSRTDWP